jgi:glyoxylase-like metal-dependent hydrolase (beta-lactamase superfamily II)
MNIESMITDFPDGISAIDTGYVRPSMTASHLLVENGRAAFVDTGPNSAVPRLLAALEAKGYEPEDVDFVCLTHVHLDHAGGAGELMALLPNAVAVLHPRGAPHMADPERLESGSRAVYGDQAFDAMYGRIRPIPEERIRVVADGEILELAGRPLRFLHTEGHARHHYCIHDANARVIFSGDSFGLSYREFDTGQGPFILPSTTPVQFDPEAAIASVDRLMEAGPEAIYLTHYSRVQDLPRLAEDLRGDIRSYVDFADQAKSQADPEAWLREAIRERLHARLDAHGCRQDADWREAILNTDIQLNAAGIMVWMKRREN